MIGNADPRTIPMTGAGDEDIDRSTTCAERTHGRMSRTLSRKVELAVSPSPGASRTGPALPNCHTVTSGCNRVTVHRAVIPFTAMTGPQPSARAAADPRTARLALELLERTAGRRRRCRRCRNVIAENARKRGQAWPVCTPCAQAIEDDARQLEIAPALLRRCLVCRTDITTLRAGARTCADACRNVLSRILRRRHRPVL